MRRWTTRSARFRRPATDVTVTFSTLGVFTRCASGRCGGRQCVRPGGVIRLSSPPASRSVSALRFPRRRHAAIVDDRHIDLLRRGVKTIETRLYRHRRLPYNRIRAGDVVFFKPAGGEVFGSADVVRIRQYDNLTPEDVRRIRRRYNHAVCAEPEYWAERLEARFAVLIWLNGFRKTRRAPNVPRQYGSGWLILRSPAFRE